MFKTDKEIFDWTKCSSNCVIEVYRYKRNKQEILAFCIFDRLEKYTKGKVDWNIMRRYADEVELGKYSSIDEVIEDFRYSFM